MVTGDEPPVRDDEGVVRLATPAGLAGVEIVVERPRIRHGESVRFETVNRGDVPLVVGRRFEVEHWNGLAWVCLRTKQAGFTDDRELLEPQQRGVPAEWPLESAERRRVRGGWYRLVKAVHHERGFATSTPIVARTRFRID
jgi:hypothetical protein